MNIFNNKNIYSCGLVCQTNIVCFHPKKISKIKIKISDVSDIFWTFRVSGFSVFGCFGKFSEISDSDVSVFGRFDLYSLQNCYHYMATVMWCKWSEQYLWNIQFLIHSIYGVAYLCIYWKFNSKDAIINRCSTFRTRSFT